MIACPECGSTNIIWDYRTGYIVCSECGIVIDRIYVQYTGKNIIESRGTNNHLISKAFDRKERKKEYNRKRAHLRRITKLLNEVKNKPYLTIDARAVEEYLMGERAHVKLFKYKTWKPENDLLLKKIIDKVVNTDPILASRTERAKWAIAKIILQLVINGKIDTKSIANETKLSITHIRRLINTVQRRNYRPNYVKKLLYEPMMRS